jgi:hypothetical protein
MADQRSLTRIGYIYGGVTAAIMMIACLVVTGQMSGLLLSNAPSAYAAQVQR